MQRALEGRRIALLGSGPDAMEIRKELIAAGAIVDELSSGGDDDRWQGARYAAMVLAGSSGVQGESRARAAQLVREMMVSEKPVGAFGVDAEALRLDESLLAVRGSGDARAFAGDVVREFSEALEEHALDEMSDQSFPASDPPSVNPGTAARVDPDGEASRQ